MVWAFEKISIGVCCESLYQLLELGGKGKDSEIATPTSGVDKMVCN